MHTSPILSFCFLATLCELLVSWVFVVILTHHEQGPNSSREPMLKLYKGA